MKPWIGIDSRWISTLLMICWLGCLYLRVDSYYYLTSAVVWRDGLYIYHHSFSRACPYRDEFPYMDANFLLRIACYQRNTRASIIQPHDFYSITLDSPHLRELKVECWYYCRHLARWNTWRQKVRSLTRWVGFIPDMNLIQLAKKPITDAIKPVVRNFGNVLEHESI